MGNLATQALLTMGTATSPVTVRVDFGKDARVSGNFCGPTKILTR